MTASHKSNIDSPHETRKFQANGHIDVVTHGDFTLGRGTFEPGDVFVIEPGHDAWTVGAESCVLYDTGVAAYAKPA